MRKLFCSVVIFLFVALESNALVEVGGSSSYRKSFVTPTAYDESLSFTGSFSYYFFSQSAIELSYTKGQSNRYAPNASYNIETIYDYEIYGADLVLVFAAPQSTFVPYIKGGGAYYGKKKITTNFINQSNGETAGSQTEQIPAALVPSAGIGLKIGITQSLSLKVGLDGWASRPLNQKPVNFDMAARVGLSWFL